MVEGRIEEASGTTGTAMIGCGLRGFPSRVVVVVMVRAVLYCLAREAQSVQLQLSYNVRPSSSSSCRVARRRQQRLAHTVSAANTVRGPHFIQPALPSYSSLKPTLKPKNPPCNIGGFPVLVRDGNGRSGRMTHSIPERSISQLTLPNIRSQAPFLTVY